MDGSQKLLTDDFDLAGITRIFTVVRSALWRKLDLRALLESYGTAGGHFRFLATPQAAYFPGF